MAVKKRDQQKIDRLSAYRAKRSAERTGEPFAAGAGPRPRIFVVQKHAARRVHYDLRLEWGGTLLSWAVPNGPSLDPSQKRLAVHVEDHPVEYADFEGVIPAGNYGAGGVIVWDRGTWTPVDDPDQGMEEGKIHFELHGYKLRGEWRLVRPKGNDKDWLLIKQKDAWARTGDEGALAEESILSGLTVEELQAGSTHAEEVRARLEKLGAPRKRDTTSHTQVMLAETAEAPFSRPGWVFELKYDGYRLVAVREKDGSARLVSRNGNDLTTVYPEIARAVRALPYDGLVLDGEMVVLDADGRPSFARLQQRAMLRKRPEIERAAAEHPTTLFLFDLLAFEDFDPRPLPLVERKALLQRLLPPNGVLRYADHVEERGREMFEQVQKLGLEGIMAKRGDSAYRPGRSGHWLKMPADRVGDFVVCGYSRPQGSRAGLGALHLGVYENGTLRYAGRVGTGFSNAQLEDFRGGLDAMREAKPDCAGNLPTGPDHVWTKPAWVAEVRYKTWTREGLLRHAVFVRLRDDKRPEECTVPLAHGEEAPVPPVPEVEPEAPAPRTLSFTNLDKVFWPVEGYTKKQLIDYYRAVSPWLLPYLEDRPLVLTRFPDGISGKSFYQKNAPGFVPDWIRTETIWSDHAEKEIDYLVCDNEETLLFLVNLGTIPFHIWSSRVATLPHPDWCIIDLDPKQAPFEHVVRLALATRELCEEIGLPSFIKTSGSTGLHVLIPLGRQCTYEQSRLLGGLMAKILAEENPEIATITRTIGERGGKVYLDFLQNRHGQLLVAPFSVRPLPGAPVSTPLEWSEVGPGLDQKKFTILTVPPRLTKQKADPLRAVLDTKTDLVSALAKLAARMETGAPAHDDKAPGAKTESGEGGRSGRKARAVKKAATDDRPAARKTPATKPRGGKRA